MMILIDTADEQVSVELRAKHGWALLRTCSGRYHDPDSVIYEKQIPDGVDDEGDEKLRIEREVIRANVRANSGNYTLSERELKGQGLYHIDSYTRNGKRRTFDIHLSWNEDDHSETTIIVSGSNHPMTWEMASASGHDETFLIPRNATATKIVVIDRHHKEASPPAEGETPVEPPPPPNAWEMLDMEDD